MILLAFDQATKQTGLSVYEDGKLLSSGLLDFSKVRDSDDRFNQMAKGICVQIDTWSPDLVILEDVDLQTNASVMKRLSQMQGVVMGKCILVGLPYLVYKP
jgi:Holliday junction resolvasome RuvABC endonuclease subunit